MGNYTFLKIMELIKDKLNDVWIDIKSYLSVTMFAITHNRKYLFPETLYNSSVWLTANNDIVVLHNLRSHHIWVLEHKTMPLTKINNIEELHVKIEDYSYIGRLNS